jgi:hypothetical protein
LKPREYYKQYRGKSILVTLVHRGQGLFIVVTGQYELRESGAALRSLALPALHPGVKSWGAVLGEDLV